MPPKVTDKHPDVEQEEAVEEQTASAARRIVATYAEDFMDGVTLMSMLGVEPDGLVHSKVAAEQNPQPAAEDDSEPKKATKKASKKASKKATKKSSKKSSKKSTKKTAKKASKKSTKKTAKKSAKKTSKKATKKSTAKKSAE